MNADLAVIFGVPAAGVLLAIAVIALLSRPRLPDLAHTPMVSTPPAGVSPALAAMIDSGTYPKPALTAAVTSLERQGFLSIAQPQKDGPFQLTRQRRDDPPSADEAVLMRELFAHGDTINIDATVPANRRILASARKRHEAAVRRAFGAVYYRAFSGPLFLLFALAAAAAGYVLWMTPAVNYVIGAAAFFAAMIGANQAFGGSGTPPPRRGPVAATLLLALLVVLPMVAIALFVTPPAPYLVVTAIGAAHGLIGAWLPRPTEEGLKAREAVQGLRAYMQASKPQPAEVSAGREAADAHYRTLRPYATAMGAAPAWNARHLALLGAMGVAVWAATHPHGASGSDGTGGWSDSGSGADLSPDRLADDMGGAFDTAFDSAFSDAFDSAVSDSTDSGSGDSGGGDSGGGGDGGGGGGE